MLKYVIVATYITMGGYIRDYESPPYKSIDDCTEALRWSDAAEALWDTGIKYRCVPWPRTAK